MLLAREHMMTALADLSAVLGAVELTPNISLHCPRIQLSRSLFSMSCLDQRNLRFSIDRGGTFTDVYAEVGSTQYVHTDMRCPTCELLILTDRTKSRFNRLCQRIQLGEAAPRKQRKLIHENLICRNRLCEL